LSPEDDSPRSIESKWNAEKEFELVSRLSTIQEPQFTIDVDKIKRKEIEECTYKPQINKMPINQPKTKQLLEVLENIHEIEEQKRKEREQKELDKLKLEEKSKKYQILRTKPPNPPSFLNRQDSCTKRNILLYVDITIKPGK